MLTQGSQADPSRSQGSRLNRELPSEITLGRTPLTLGI